MITNIQEEKQKINQIISMGCSEILQSFPIVSEGSLPLINDDVDVFMRAMQAKNKIFDYAIDVDYDFLNHNFFIKVAYTLINSKNSQYQDLVEIKF